MKTIKIMKYIAVLFWVSIMTSSAKSQQFQNDSLHYYIKIALEKNPQIQAQQFKHEAFLEKIPQAGAFQDPELTIEAYTMPMEVIGGKSLGNITFMQMLPWFGTKKAAQKEANHQANMQNQEYLESLYTLTLQVSTQWFVIQKLQVQLRNNEENKSLLEQVEKLAIRKLSAPSSNATQSTSMANNSQSSLAETLRIQLEITEVENNIESLKALIKTEKAKFNILLNRGENEPINTGSEIQKIDFQPTDTDALQAILQNNPVLGMLKEEALAFRAKSEMDRKMSYPMIGFGVQYMAIGKTNNPMFAMEGMNGKDMFMPMLTVSLPIFRKKYSAQQRESKLWWQSSEATYQNSFNSLKSEYYGYKNQLEDAERVVRLYEKQSKLAETTYNLIVKEFVTGQSDLTNVIQVQRQLLDYKLKKAEALANYNTSVVSIQKLLSTKIITDYSKK